MASSSFYIIAYDITSDRERDRVARVLEGFGVRAQFSVFECRLSRGMKERLLRDLAALEIATGTVTLYPARTDRRPTYLGPPKPGPDFTERSGDEAWIV